MTLADDVNLEEFVMTKDEFSGADIKAICTEAGLLALRERRMKVLFCIYWCEILLLFSSPALRDRVSNMFAVELLALSIFPLPVLSNLWYVDSET